MEDDETHHFLVMILGGSNRLSFAFLSRYSFLNTSLSYGIPEPGRETKELKDRDEKERFIPRSSISLHRRILGLCALLFPASLLPYDLVFTGIISREDKGPDCVDWHV